MIFEKSPRLTLQVPRWGIKFSEIALPNTVSEINVLLHFTQKFKLTTKNGTMIFGKSQQ